MNDFWPYLRITLLPALEEPVTAIVFDCGCSGTAADTITAPTEPHQPPVLTAWFPDDGSRDEAFRRLSELSDGLEPAVRPLVESGNQESEDWLARWREGQQPFAVGRRLLVVPGEDDPDPEFAGDRLVLRITPGLAFGTGHHETTRFCLEQLEGAAGEGVDFLDVGTGSGILAVAAVLLGCGRVVGADIDPDAVRVAGETLEAHDLAGRVELLVTGTPETVGLPAFPLVAANILGSTLIGLSPALSGPLLAPGGRLLLAGILAGDEEQRVLTAYETCGLTCRLRAIDGEWAGLVLDKTRG